MRARKHDVDAVISGIYDAAFDEQLWSDVLARVSDLAASTGAHLIGFDHRSLAPRFGFMGRYPQEAHAEYSEHYASRDVRVRRIVQRLPVRAITDDVIISLEERRRCPVHQEFLTKYEGDRMLVQGFQLDARTSAFLAVFRAEHRGGYDPREMRVLERVVPHVHKAIEIGRRLGHLSARVDALEEAVDNLSFALILVDRDRRIRFASAAARAILRRADGLVGPNNRLGAVESADTNALGAGIAAAARRGRPVATGAVRVRRNNELRPYQVVIAPLAPANGLYDLAEDSEVAVMVADPEGIPMSLADVLGTLYELTPAEVELVIGLLEGDDLVGYAERRGISRETAKTHLRSVFDKTDCRRQSQLLRLVSQIPAPWTAPRIAARAAR